MSKSVLVLITMVLTFAVGTVVPADGSEILLKKSFWSGMKFSVDNGFLYMKVGVTGKDLRIFMDGNEAAQAEMDLYRSRAIVSWICSATSGGIIGWTVAEAGDIGWRKSHTQWVVGATVLLTVGVLTDRSATKHLKEAVRLYNGEPGELSLSIAILNHTDDNQHFYEAGFRWRF